MWQGYESQMLSRNTIEGVLKFQIRQMDNGVRFYYEITSRQPLSRVLENRNIQAEEIRRLVVGIFGVLERVERYLLREGSILLDPQYLYVDSDTFRVWLCLIPGAEKNFSRGFQQIVRISAGQCGSSGQGKCGAGLWSLPGDAKRKLWTGGFGASAAAGKRGHTREGPVGYCNGKDMGREGGL